MNELCDCCIEMRRCSDALSVFFYMSLTISDTVGKMTQSHHASSRGASPMNFQDRRLPSARTRESISWTRECKPDQSSTATELNCRTWTAGWKLHEITGFRASMRKLAVELAFDEQRCETTFQLTKIVVIPDLQEVGPWRNERPQKRSLHMLMHTGIRYLLAKNMFISFDPRIITSQMFACPTFRCCFADPWAQLRSKRSKPTPEPNGQEMQDTYQKKERWTRFWIHS